jgi:deoxyribodipyrimidine photo-lyase
MRTRVVCWWLRRDLRLHDNAALHAAQQAARQMGAQVLPVFIFDTDILDKLPRTDYRVVFIHQTITKLQRQLAQQGKGLLALHGKPQQVWAQLLAEYDIAAAYVGRDYEPYAKTRDAAVAKLLAAHGATLFDIKDHVLQDHGDAVLTQGGAPFKVFTPYKNAWLAKLDAGKLQSFASENDLGALADFNTPPAVPTLPQMGFTEAPFTFPPPHTDAAILQHYAERRNFPGVAGTSRLGVHLRFGTISVRQLARQAQAVSAVFLNELIWRDFYAMVLHHFPHVATRAFKPAYDGIPWRNNTEEFARWCTGQTGYPIVDAGMRELNETGYMHNRVRMIVASFLTKHLLIDWRLGEAYFAEKLLDFDLASNNGGWQWAAGSGTDAAPYFRIFNPEEQTRKFDPKLDYVRRWVPQLGQPQYPQPIVAHAFARARALQTYKQALGAAS